MMTSILSEFLDLNDRNKMPSMGFGTANLGNRSNKISAFQYALDAGYRHFDSASMYNNEKELGEILQNALLEYDREELFITSKLWNSDHGYEKTKKAVAKSLEYLKLDYLDLYMTHWPVPNLRNDSWRAMEELVEEGLIKSIGVSNYTIRHLSELLEIASIKPVVNQVEFSPFLYQKELHEFCRENNIILEAYSPILSVVRKRADNKILNDLGLKYNKSIAQIAIKWSLQLGNSVIPRSSNKERINENARVYDFSLSDEDMALLSKLNEDLRLEWDPTDEP
ncbi:MAG: 2,5-diketo-D-gluconic acid reductase A [Candidatus Heimdallarchaeota archaeon LC_2]|nr:MAG: 2,5-diketo-D-gluconic acid reductase A [Candidatus Heimdallarchaeota archaeon LC_2]